MKGLLVIALSIFSILSMVLLLWALAFQARFLSILFLATTLAFIPLMVRNKKLWIIRAAVFFPAVAVLVFMINRPIEEINHSIKRLASKARNESSLAAFSTWDKLGIYGLNVVMGLAAIPRFPEASRETLLMIFPSPPTGVRVFRSNFALKSAVVQKALKKMKGTLRAPNNATDEYELGEQVVQWSASDYTSGEARFALALNASRLAATASRRDSSWVIDATLSVRCEYPRDSYVSLMVRPELKMEEGLFWVLQRAGWLHPYTAVWKLRVDDSEI